MGRFFWLHYFSSRNVYGKCPSDGQGVFPQAERSRCLRLIPADPFFYTADHFPGLLWRDRVERSRLSQSAVAGAVYPIASAVCAGAGAWGGADPGGSDDQIQGFDCPDDIWTADMDVHYSGGVPLIPDPGEMAYSHAAESSGSRGGGVPADLVWDRQPGLA